MKKDDDIKLVLDRIESKLVIILDYLESYNKKVEFLIKELKKNKKV